MKLYDFHTHNGYSGCASKYPYSIAEGWKAIQKRGIVKWGISNHYPTRPVYGDYIPALRKEVDDMENENILLGVELEMKSEDGESVLLPHHYHQLDYIIGSVHELPHDFLTLPDITEDEIADFFASFRRILINGFEKIPVRIWGHPFMNEFEKFGGKYWKDYLLPIFQDCLEVIAKRNIAIDINPSYAGKCARHPEVSNVLDDLFTLAMNTPDVYFVTSSDAHSLANLGDLSIPLSYVKKYKIPESRILEIYKK